VVTIASILALLLLFSTAPAQEQAGRRRSENRTSLSASRVVSGDYFAFGELVEISGTINGDLYASGDQVIVDGRVNGDVLVAGRRVSLTGTVSQDVRAAGGKVTFAGSIGRNVTVAGGTVELGPSAVIGGGLVAAGGSVDLSAPVGGAAKVTARTLTVANRVGGDVDAAVGTLRITSRADVQGDVNYWSGREAVVSEEARIGGKTVRNVPPERPRIFPAAVVAWFILVSASFVSTLILGLLSVRFLPRFHQSVVGTIAERPWASLGIGFMAAVMLPVVCAFLFATVVAVPVALLLLAAFFVLVYWTRIYAISRIGEAILGRLRPNSSPGFAFVVGLFVYYLFAMIPFIAWLLVPLVILFGLGAELIARKKFYVSARRQELI
jgi:hypothetical protein